MTGSGTSPERSRRADALEDAQNLAGALARDAGGAVDVIILYGSHLLGANPDRHSALDFVVVVDAYRRFYQALRAAGESHRPVWLMTTLARVLAPNVIAYTPEEGRGGVAKCLVVSRSDFKRALGPRRRDHMLVARMIQKVAVLWAADEERAAWGRQRLEEARADVLDWVGPYLEEPFDAEAVGRRVLEVCYRAELRPEAKNRADTIFQSQRDHFHDTLTPVLETEARSGRLVTGPGGYRFTQAPGGPWRRRVGRYLLKSKMRVTARWLKHILTFDNWLPYIVRKVERRTGTRVELTRMERKLPLLLLWPKVIRVLRARPDREEPRA